MPKRKNAKTILPSAESSPKDRLLRGLGDILRFQITKETKEQLDDEHIEMIHSYGVTLKNEYELRDQLKHIESKKQASIRARTSGKKRLSAPKKVVTLAHTKLKERLGRNPTLKKDLLPELLCHCPKLIKPISYSTLKDWLSDLNKGKKILDGT